MSNVHNNSRIGSQVLSRCGKQAMSDRKWPWSENARVIAGGVAVARADWAAGGRVSGVLACLGLDHERLTDRFQGRQYRLTDVSGQVANDILT